MLTLRCITKTRAFLPPIPTSILLTDASSSSNYTTTTAPFFSNSLTTAETAPSTPPPPPPTTIHSSDVVLSFKDWFRSRNNTLLDRFFDILRRRGPEPGSSDVALAQLALHLSESFVLGVLNYGESRKDVLSCLKFFDWAGHQPGPFHHTRATFIVIFKILSKAKLMSLMLDFLDTFTKQRSAHKVRFYSTLVMGYAVAGKPEVALQLFGRMRFQGIDLDGFAYHVLLNALVGETYFDAVDVVAK